MLTLKIRYSNTQSQVKLKTSWYDVTYSDYCKLLENTAIEDDVLRYESNIAVLCGLTVEEVKQFDSNIKLSLLPYLKFIDSLDSILIKQVDNLPQIGEEAWSLLEACKQQLKHANNAEVARSMIAVTNIYCEVDIEQMPFIEAIPYARHFENQLSDFFLKFRELSEYKPTAEELQAGIDTLNVFGFMNTLDALANGDILKHEEVLKQSADYVFTKLLMDYRKSKFNSKHSEILSKKK